MTLIIAEAGVNHNGDISIAHKLIKATDKAGADIVKFQTFKLLILPLNQLQKNNSKFYLHIISSIKK